MQVIDNYTKACEDIRNAFIERYGLTDSFWVADEVGGILFVGDFYFSMTTLITALEENVSLHQLLEWYDYTIEAQDIGFPVPNLKSWLKGCPVATDAEIIIIKNAQKRCAAHDN